MEKKDFLCQYVLNRTLTNRGGLDGYTVAREAEKAWRMINELCKEQTINGGGDAQILISK